jgi:hypothetical protein
MPGKEKEQPKTNPFTVEPADTEVRELGPEDEVRDPSQDATDTTGRDEVAGNDEVARLREENDRLRAQLAENDARLRAAKPQQPSFGISEGTRNDLEMHGKTTDPFTGKQLTQEDLDR